ncbi:serine--tRNA ligase [Ktedonospora formicarum]|uniref:Serine--tRNA ligase n=1 Tax=Ktedonospora formicarum TaxID=2778364 RepID=A0A8J3HYV4_9CHLR|nr:serine--tRNA ligase [Ktedonospora formicarum]GHO43162.1 serine--tRNA ligase [Ktedonospora formicarum]
MLSLDFICQYPQVVREALRRRHEAHNIDEVLRLAEQRRGLATRNDGLYTSLKGLRAGARNAPAENRPGLNKQIKAIMQDIRQLELQIADVDTRLQLLLMTIPNLPQHQVQDDADIELRRWGEAATFHFTPLAHWELGERLGILDATSAAQIAGSRFMTLKGYGAKLERALISFFLDIHTREFGYTEIIPPFLTRRAAMLGAGQLPKFEEQAYACSMDELYLNPTAEVPLVGMHIDSILNKEELPLRYAAWTTAFRREAGSASRHQRGLLRLHQFDKVELFQVTPPTQSYAIHEQMLLHAETPLRLLELPYRVVDLCAANLPFSASRTFDIEVWLPSLQEYIEVSSVSNCEGFQANRANIKYRPRNGARAEYVHTLNASGLAVGRTMAAILEVYQQADGSVVVPKVLRPYMRTSLIPPAR